MPKIIKEHGINILEVIVHIVMFIAIVIIMSFFIVKKSEPSKDSFNSIINSTMPITPVVPCIDSFNRPIESCTPITPVAPLGTIIIGVVKVLIIPCTLISFLFAKRKKGLSKFDMVITLLIFTIICFIIDVDYWYYHELSDWIYSIIEFFLLLILSIIPGKIISYIIEGIKNKKMSIKN